MEAVKSSKTYMEAKLNDIEREKTMLELHLNETISRNRTDLTEKIARLAQLEEKSVVLQSKIESKNRENEKLWTTLEQEREGEGGVGACCVVFVVVVFYCLLSCFCLCCSVIDISFLFLLSVCDAVPSFSRRVHVSV